MSKLYIIGDSFTAPPPTDATELVWTMKVARALGAELVNGSRIGASQDYCWAQLTQVMQVITADDYLIVAVTHPSRYWFFEDIPQLTHSNIIDFDNYCSREQAKAAEMYIRYIQRPQLDTLHLTLRMSYLAYHIKSKGLRRPLMIKCFQQDVGESEHYPEFNWAVGTLTSDVEMMEFNPPSLGEDIGKIWNGADVRYNHLCLCNHEIMTNKVVEALSNDTVLDLTQGFNQGMLDENSLFDDTLLNTQFRPDVVLTNREHKQSQRKSILPWANRTQMR